MYCLVRAVTCLRKWWKISMQQCWNVNGNMIQCYFINSYDITCVLTLDSMVRNQHMINLTFYVHNSTTKALFCKWQFRLLMLQNDRIPAWQKTVLELDDLCVGVTFWICGCVWKIDRLCGLVVRVSGYRYRGLGFDSWRYQIFWVVVGLKRGPLSLVRSIEELIK